MIDDCIMYYQYFVSYYMLKAKKLGIVFNNIPTAFEDQGYIKLDNKNGKNKISYFEDFEVKIIPKAELDQRIKNILDSTHKKASLILNTNLSISLNDVLPKEMIYYNQLNISRIKSLSCAVTLHKSSFDPIDTFAPLFSFPIPQKSCSIFLKLPEIDPASLFSIKNKDNSVKTLEIISLKDLI